MKTTAILVFAGTAILVYVAIVKYYYSRHNKKSSIDRFNLYTENPGTENCENMCFSSPYYDACMNTCLQGGRADYMETGSEYDVLGIDQVDDLDRGYGYSNGPRDMGLRGETAGH